MTTTEASPRLLYPIQEAAALLGIKRTTMYDLIARGDVEHVKIGRRSLITADSLGNYVTRLTQAATGTRGE